MNGTNSGSPAATAPQSGGHEGICAVAAAAGDAVVTITEIGTNVPMKHMATAIAGTDLLCRGDFPLEILQILSAIASGYYYNDLRNLESFRLSRNSLFVRCRDAPTQLESRVATSRRGSPASEHLHPDPTNERGYLSIASRCLLCIASSGNLHTFRVPGVSQSNLMMESSA